MQQREKGSRMFDAAKFKASANNKTARLRGPFELTCCEVIS
jgi:hypothetical protein